MTDLLQFGDAGSMRKYSREQRLAGKRIALVPTMVSLRRLHGVLRRDATQTCASPLCMHESLSLARRATCMLDTCLWWKQPSK